MKREKQEWAKNPKYLLWKYGMLLLQVIAGVLMFTVCWHDKLPK